MVSFFVIDYGVKTMKKYSFFFHSKCFGFILKITYNVNTTTNQNYKYYK